VKSKINSTKARALAVLALAIATVTAGAGSLAILTDTVTIASPQQVATIVLTGNNSHAISFPVSTWYSAGEKTYTPIVWKNAGTGELRYSLASTATGNPSLDAALVVSARFNSDPTRCTAAEWSGLGANGPASVTPSTFAFGSSAQGAQAGDRLLAPGESSMMCIEVRYPGGVTDGSVLSWNSTASAEQTFNNP
jgi:hypothetical protein